MLATMLAEIIDGKACAARCRARIAAEAAPLLARGVRPGLAVVLAGDDPASHVYVRSKTVACAAVGFRAFDHRFPATVTEPDRLPLVEGVNGEPEVDGILVQLPLPAGIDARQVLLAISPNKD